MIEVARPHAPFIAKVLGVFVLGWYLKMHTHKKNKKNFLPKVLTFAIECVILYAAYNKSYPNNSTSNVKGFKRVLRCKRGVSNR